MILITGNAGFIGSYLSKAIIKKGYEIRGLDIRAWCSKEKLFEHVEGNILDKDLVRRAMTDVDCVIHLAAEHADYGIRKEKYYEVNVQGTKILLDVASELQIKKFLFYSSVAVYGKQQSLDEMVPAAPNNDYGASKLFAEEAVKTWADQDSSRSAIIIRPTVVFGPRGKANIFKLIKQVCDKKFIWVGDGSSIKSIAYVENLVDATMFLLDRIKPGTDTYNYSDEPHLTTQAMVQMISRLAGVPEPKMRIPKSIALCSAGVFDILGKLTKIDFPVTSARIKKFNTPTFHQSKKIRSLGFRPAYSLDQGFESNIKWYIEQRENMRFAESSD